MSGASGGRLERVRAEVRDVTRTLAIDSENGDVEAEAGRQAWGQEQATVTRDVTDEHAALRVVHLHD